MLSRNNRTVETKKTERSPFRRTLRRKLRNSRVLSGAACRPFCPASKAYLALPASPVLPVFPAADVPAAVFVPAFAAVDRVFVRAAATAVVVSVEAAVVFARAAVVAFARLRVVFDQPAAVSDRPETVVSVRPAAVFAHSNCFVPASDAAGLAAARSAGAPDPVWSEDPEVPAGASVRAAD